MRIATFNSFSIALLPLSLVQTYFSNICFAFTANIVYRRALLFPEGKFAIIIKDTVAAQPATHTVAHFGRGKTVVEIVREGI